MTEQSPVGIRPVSAPGTCRRADALLDVRDLRAELIAHFRWRSAPPVWPEKRTHYADYARWWLQPAILQSVGPALANLFSDATPTVVMGVEAHGSLLGPWLPTLLASVSPRCARAHDRAPTSTSG